MIWTITGAAVKTFARAMDRLGGLLWDWNVKPAQIEPPPPDIRSTVYLNGRPVPMRTTLTRLPGKHCNFCPAGFYGPDEAAEWFEHERTQHYGGWALKQRAIATGNPADQTAFADWIRANCT